MNVATWEEHRVLSDLAHGENQRGGAHKRPTPKPVKAYGRTRWRVETHGRGKLGHKDKIVKVFDTRAEAEQFITRVLAGVETGADFPWEWKASALQKREQAACLEALEIDWGDFELTEFRWFRWMDAHAGKLP